MFNIEASKELSLQLLSQISEKINELAPKRQDYLRSFQNPKLRNEIKVTILATSSEVENRLRVRLRKHRRRQRRKKKKWLRLKIRPRKRKKKRMKRRCGGGEEVSSAD
jgi:cell division GTPase FtsZ